MSIHHPNESPEAPSGRNDVPEPTANGPISRSRASCGMGGNSMSLMLAVFVGVAIGAFVFGGSGGVASAAQGGSWTFLLFLIPCLLMFGAMMMMMGNKSGSDGKP